MDRRAGSPDVARRLVARGDGTDANEVLAEKWARINASRWAAPAERQDNDRAAGARSSAARSVSQPDAEYARLVRKARKLNPWISAELAEIVADAWAKMKPPADSGAGLWWRTVSDRLTRCRCGAHIPAGDRYLYRHHDRAVLCRDCGTDEWDDAKPSKALRRFAKQRRDELAERRAA